MTDQGWAVDDGTCDPCWHDRCHQCTKPIDWPDSDGDVQQSCCCEEGYDLGHVGVASDGGR